MSSFRSELRCACLATLNCGDERLTRFWSGPAALAAQCQALAVIARFHSTISLIRPRGMAISRTNRPIDRKLILVKLDFLRVRGLGDA